MPPRLSRSSACRSRSCRTWCRSIAASSKRSTRGCGRASTRRPCVAALHAPTTARPFVRLTGSGSAGDQARRAHELLRHRLARRTAWRSARDGGLHRQPREGRGRPGDPELQRRVRLRRRRRRSIDAATTITLLKLGGELLDDAAAMRRRRQAIAALAAAGRWSSCTAAAARSTPSCAPGATTPRFVDGLRVTDAAALDAVVSRAGRADQHGARRGARRGGGRAVGLTGADAAHRAVDAGRRLHDASRVRRSTSASSGSPTAADASLLTRPAALGYVPVSRASACRARARC